MRVKTSQRQYDESGWHHLTSDRNSKKTCENVKLFGMKIITDQFGNRWHKYTMDVFERQRIEALFGDRWHK